MKCLKCGLEIENDKIDDHNLTCSYAFSNADFENLIPCEFCNELISFEDYQTHVNICSTRSTRIPIPPQLPIFNIRNFPSLNNNQANSEMELEEDEDENNINRNINGINNDPIARSLFNMFFGGLPVNNLQPSENALNNNIIDNNENNNELVNENNNELANENNNELANENNNELVNENNNEIVNENQNLNIDNQLNLFEFSFLPNMQNLNQNNNNNDPDAMDIDEPENNTNNANENTIDNINNLINLFDNLLNDHQLNQNIQNPNPNLNIVLPNIFGDDENDDYENLINLQDHEVGISNIDDISELLFEEIECPICSETKMLTRKTKCNHKFCDDCLKEWLKSNKKCPFCMVELE